MKDELPVTLSGTVRHFEGNGRKFGYPTANIGTATTLADGVYFGFAELATYKRQSALIFVGIPVTVDASQRRVEAHLLDIPDVDYYDQQLTLDIQYFHRPNQKFASIDELLAVMKNDEAAARSWFSKKE